MAFLLVCSASLAGFKPQFKPKASISSFSARGSCYKTRAVSKRGSISVQAAAAPISWSVSDYDDVLEEKYKCEMIKQCKIGMSATAPIESMMTVEVVTTTPKTKLTDAKEAFGQFSGMPVICPHDGTLLGVVSQKDLRSTWDQATIVMDVMSRPAITVQPHNTIQDAACLMLKYKIHRLPVVDANNVCVGIVTRSDIFSALGMFH